MPRPSYDTWLASARGSSLDGDRLTVSVPSAFAADWIEQNIQSLVEAEAAMVAGRAISVAYVVGDQHALPAPTPAGRGAASAAASPREPASPLWPGFTFASYVVGPANQLAFAAAQAIARGGGATAYNPLLIYGDVGAGKTHLLHAIGWETSSAGLSTLYVTAEQFTNEFLAALRTKQTDEFRERYRTLDVLLLDDVQSLAGKPSTQQAFFDTFNALFAAGGQLVLTSDRPAGELTVLERRLRSRFEAGLQADIAPPDYDLRVAMLTAFAQRDGIAIPDAGLDFIATRVTGSIRALRGAVVRVAAFVEFTGREITPDLIADAIGAQTREAPTVDDVLHAVAAHRGVPVASITGRKRSREAASARLLAMHILHARLGLSVAAIAGLMSNRDHGTVSYSLRRIDPNLAREAEGISLSLDRTEGNSTFSAAS